MKSKIRSAQIIHHCFIVLIVSGLAGGILYDLHQKMSFKIKILMWLLFIGYPLFVAYATFKIPSITLLEDRITEKTINGHKEIRYAEISEIISSKFLNKIYKIGIHYCIQSIDGSTINIPLKMYCNEEELITEINQKATTMSEHLLSSQT